MLALVQEVHDKQVCFVVHILQNENHLEQIEILEIFFLLQVVVDVCKLYEWEK